MAHIGDRQFSLHVRMASLRTILVALSGSLVLASSAHASSVFWFGQAQANFAISAEGFLTDPLSLTHSVTVSNHFGADSTGSVAGTAAIGHLAGSVFGQVMRPTRFDVEAGGTLILGWADTITVVGTGNVTLTFAPSLSDSLSSACEAGGDAGAVLSFGVFGPGGLSGGITDNCQSSSGNHHPLFTRTVQAGSQFVLNERLTLLAEIPPGVGLTDNSGSADASHTAEFFVDVLTPGAFIVSESGHDFSTPRAPVPLPNNLLLLSLGLAAIGARRVARRLGAG